MFEHFQNLFRSSRRKRAVDAEEETASETTAGDEPQNDAEPPASCADASRMETVAWEDPEAEELEALYRQTLNTMDQLESECHFAAEEWEEAEPTADTAARRQHEETEADGAGAATDHAASPSHFETEAAGPPVAAQHVVEAALFVGGVDLTLKRLGSLLRDEFPPETIEAFIEELNTRYREENRPYEIRFGEGGYRLALRSDFDDVRNRVFGLGPKEIKLSQEALEVLSLVAYEQPVTGERITELRGSNASSILRQLLRRELVALERSDDEQKAIRYRTTPRFLQAFGLASLDDLPKAEDLAFK